MDLISKITFIIIASLVTLIMAILDYSKIDKRTYKKIRAYLYVTMIFLFSLGIWTTIRDHQNESSLRKENILFDRTIDSLSRLNAILSVSNSSKIDTSISKLDKTLSKSQTILTQIQNEGKNISNIYNLNRNIQYPLPKKVKASFYVSCKFDDSLTTKIDSTIKLKYQLDKRTVVHGIEVHFVSLEHLINWNTFLKNVTIHFAKNFKEGESIHSIFELANYDRNYGHMPHIKIDDKNNGQVFLVYYPESKELALVFESIQLSSIISPLRKFKSNYNARSIIDLENTTLILNLYLSEVLKEYSITFFEIESDELNLFRTKLDKTKWGLFFTTAITTL